ncbi:MAG: hypothetical protein HY298_13990 [Verrucomicrobia bacterium]|nr:hypothetical protein [Verrucomicrobiota bacterium]
MASTPIMPPGTKSNTIFLELFDWSGYASRTNRNAAKWFLTFDPLPDEAHLNWRQQSRVSEVWLLKH